MKSSLDNLLALITNFLFENRKRKVCEILKHLPYIRQVCGAGIYCNNVAYDYFQDEGHYYDNSEKLSKYAVKIIQLCSYVFVSEPHRHHCVVSLSKTHFS